MYDDLQKPNIDKSITQNALTIVKETTSWLYSVNAFYKKVQTYSEAFPDLAKPLQSSISQIVYSVTSLNDLIRELIVKIDQGPVLKEVVTDLMAYPNNIPNRDVKEAHLNRFINEEFVQLLNRSVVLSSENRFGADLEYIE